MAAVASLLLIAAGLIVVTSQRERHQIGSNWVRPVVFVVEDLDAGERLCQGGMRIPAGTGGVGLRLGTYGRPGPAIDLTIRSPGAAAVRGRLAPGWHQGDIVVPVPELGAERRGAEVCVRHAGDGALAVAGGPGTGDEARRGDDEVPGMVRLEYVEPHAESWWPVIPAMADRLAVAHGALPGALTLPLFGLLALVVLGGALALVTREGRR